MARKSLRQLGESSRHSYDTRLIVGAERHMIKKAGEDCEFLVWLPVTQKDRCESLSRRGRDPLTTILVKDVWNDAQVRDFFERESTPVPVRISEAIKDSPGHLCFCRCEMKIRHADVNGAPR